MCIPFVPAAAAPRGPATTAPLGPAQPARTTPAAHSTACAVGMTPASRGRTVAIANSVDFISYLLVGSSSGKIARRAAAPRERERVLNVDPPYAEAMPVDADEFRGEVPAPETVISALVPRIVKSR